MSEVLRASNFYSAIVVSGADGWLGRGIVDALLDGLADVPRLTAAADVPLFLFDKNPLPPDAPARAAASQRQITILQGDIRNPADCQRLFANVPADALVLHTAGLIHPPAFAVRELAAVNVRGTRNIYEATAAARARRFVAVSSNSPCGCNASRHDRFNEDAPYRPYLAYGRSKMQMEQFFRAQNTADGNPAWTIIRAPWFYGTNQPPRQKLFFQMVRDGKGPIIGDGGNYRSMAYIDNLVQGLLLAAYHESAAGEVYWIADAEPYQMTTILDTIERLLETEFNIPCQRRRLRLPSAAAEVAYACDWLLQAVGCYHPKIHVLSEMNKTIACDIRRAQVELGYAPTVALEEGMRRSIAAARDQL